MTKLETSFDIRYNHNGKNFNVYIKDNIASININNTFSTPGYTTIWKKEYNGISMDDIVKDINSVLKNDIIPMYESMVEDMKSSLIQYKGL